MFMDDRIKATILNKNRPPQLKEKKEAEHPQKESPPSSSIIHQSQVQPRRPIIRF